MEENTEINTFSEEKKSFGPAFFLIFLVGLFAINALWLLNFPLERRNLYLFLTSIGLSLILFLLTIYRALKIQKENSKTPHIETSSAKNEENAANSDIQEDELKLTNEKLQKVTQEFEETTRRLFEREMELKSANKRLREIDSVKSEFVSTAAHQLRTPLTGIKWSYTTLLESSTGPLNATQKEIVDKGLEAIDFAISVINDLLNTARLEEGKSGFDFTEQPIGPIIKSVVSQHQAVIDEKKIKFSVDFPLDSPFAFRFDKERITIVFDNILTNAVKYTPPEGSVSIKSFRSEKEIKFKIIDSGIGIPEKDLYKVFSKFYRSKNAVSFETSGSGLGLYVAKNIVERHGGTIDVESVENKGTTFTIALPV